ncbi:MotA/TolQ/ExbB proton channel family protein [Actinophytocola sp.]|uniref:MotA/TolQ/ExbB proton channel family protein n=1 Tax=Actinophytocola sp. TaxID=1872138 RepID=UPI002D469D95|nr:MotA/TolQ/ExbB proton channel family protein [Actinophytocola sp.]HYQ66161.1 MotA/TolQ/ExbB proton channel family protein [Actinophytocola sp.]
MNDQQPTPPVDDAAVDGPAVGDGEGREVTRREPSSLEPAAVWDAELVSDEEYRSVQRRKALERYRGYRRDVVVAATAARRAVTHPRTKTTTKFVARNTLYVLQGAGVVGRRVWETKTNSRYERQLRSAEAAGNQELLQEWESRAEQARQRRHDRRMDWLQAPGDLAKAIGIFGITVFGILLTLGVLLAIASQDASRILGPIQATLDLIEWTAWALTIAWGPFVLAAPWILVLVLWHIGRTKATTPAWVAASTTTQDEMSTLVTADGIVRALRHLNIPALNKAFKDGWMPRFELTPTREGTGAFKGYRAIFDLPDGVTPSMVADKREVLAVNLRRITMEVWPSDYGQEKGGRAGCVNLYVADAGIMNKPTPEYPLLHDGTADVFEGVPIGITQRGDVVLMPINGSNTGFGGRPGQGKSNAVRVVFAGAALDPLAELRVHVFAGNGDFDAYERRLSRYHKGADPVHAALATEHLHDLLAEVERRETRLAELGAKKLTRQIAQQHPDMRPLVVGFSECHELFGDEENGKTAADLAIRVVKRGRKTGVFTVWDTQSARADAIPSSLVENIGVNCCFSVKTWQSNDGFLGAGSFAAGIRATELRFNVDRGTMVTTGLTEELYEIVRTFFIEVNDDTGYDAATEIIDRAMDLLDPATPLAGRRPVLAIETSRDLLEDLDDVLDNDPVPAGEVIGALRTLAPNWRPYRDLTVPKLVAELSARGVKVPTSKNKYPIDPVTVRVALARQATADLDDDQA